MGKIALRHSKLFLTFLLGTVTGIILGTACLTLLISYRMDRYYHKVRYLQNVIEDKDIRFKKLEETINKRKFILKEIEVNLKYDGDEIEKTDIETEIKNRYTHLLGNEVKSIDIETAAKIVDKTIIQVGSKEYRLKVDKLMLAEVLKIWVEVDLKD